MTPDEIEKAAIEASAIEIHMSWMDQPGWELWEVGGTSRLQQAARQVARDARNAYERAMWRSAKSIPKDGSKHLLSDGVDVWIGSERDSDKSHMGMPVDGHELHSGPKGWQQRATHFRSLPKPGGV